MRLTLVLLGALSVAVVAPVPAGAAPARSPGLGAPVKLPIRVPASSRVVSAVSAAGHGPALVTAQAKGAHSITTVLHQDRGGTWRRFTVLGRPQAVRLALLEDGSGLAAFDQGNTVVVRRWSARGTVGAPQVVLRSVQTTWEGDFVTAEWQLSAGRDGTVAIASSGDATSTAGAIYATVRDPGGAFSPQQQVTPEAVSPPVFGAPDLAVAPIAAGGSVIVRWAPHGNGGPGDVRSSTDLGYAVRAGRATTFGPPQAPPGPAPVADLSTGLAATTPTPLTVAADQSSTVRVGRGVVALCARASGGCSSPQLFTWGGRRAIAFNARSCHDCVDAAVYGSWYVARSGAGGVVDHPVLATRDASAVPVRSAARGVVAFAQTGDGVRSDSADGVFLSPTCSGRAC
ncbi:MAG: hypothetical protein QOH30_1970 [Baekduia sp.]|jgi:hypothetical protein|nr:hypothetical protein [Baekduia sp.]